MSSREFFIAHYSLVSLPCTLPSLQLEELNLEPHASVHLGYLESQPQMGPN